MQGTNRLRTDPTVAEGGVIVVHVAEGVRQVHFTIPGHSTETVTVRGGRAEFRVPAEVRGGATVLVTDGLVPRPSSTTVTVVGGQSR
jgi:hypothetical protein